MHVSVYYLNLVKLFKKTYLKNLLILVKNVRLIYATRTPLLVDQKWRREKKLSLNPNKESPLTYLPDFTYMDGRSTPIGVIKSIILILTFINTNIFRGDNINV